MTPWLISHVLIDNLKMLISKRHMYIIWCQLACYCIQVNVLFIIWYSHHTIFQMIYNCFVSNKRKLICNVILYNYMVRIILYFIVKQLNDTILTFYYTVYEFQLSYHGILNSSFDIHVIRYTTMVAPFRRCIVWVSYVNLELP